VVSTTPRLLYHRERTGTTHCTGGWVGPRAGLDECETFRPPTPTGIRSTDRQACSQSLYRLSYPAHVLPYGKWEIYNVIIIAFSFARDFGIELKMLMDTFCMFKDTRVVNKRAERKQMMITVK
jgi:hypothetical protein